MSRDGGGGTGADSDAQLGPPVTAAEREALLRKYRIMAAWRQRKDAETSVGGGRGGGGGGDREGAGHGEPETDPAAPDRAALRALAREFPGALRELDLLGLPEMSRRIARLSELAKVPPANVVVRPPHPDDGDDGDGDGDGDGGADGDGHDDRWIAWIVSYHALMQAALHIKRLSGRTRALSPEAKARVSALLGSAYRVVADPCRPTTPPDEFVASFVSSVIHPPEGRLGIVVLTTLAEWFRIAPAELSRVLFPPRRPPPYQL